MDWLAVQYKSGGDLFLQHRTERENSNSALIDMKKVIETRVIKKFQYILDAQYYIKNINEVNKLLRNVK